MEADARELVTRVCRKYRERFGGEPAEMVLAPGRVNLIGEHIDYNDGFVLPMAIDRHVALAAGPSPDDRVHVLPSGGLTACDFDPVKPRAGEPSWANYLKGVVAGFRERGIETPPFCAAIEADLPSGAGLSSSAALEVATATLLESLTGQSLDPVEKALLCQRAEHEFAGVPCGIMDQFAVTLSRERHLLLLDCRSREVEHVRFTDGDIAVVIANSNVSHALADGEYAKRRDQCAEAARILGIESWRDANWIQLEMAREAGKLDDVLFRRARHVVTEIERTTNCANRLRAREWTAVAALLYSSHESLRDDYEVSCPELDKLVEIAQSPDFDGLVYGSRMTGGGFGGSTVSLVHRRILDRFMESLETRYRDATGHEPSIFATRPSLGARRIDRAEVAGELPGE